MATPTKWDNLDIDVAALRCTEGVPNGIVARVVLERILGAVWDPSDESIYIHGDAGIIRARPDGRVQFYATGFGWTFAVVAGPGLLIGSNGAILYWLDFRGQVLDIRRLHDFSTEVEAGEFDAIAISKDGTRVVVSANQQSLLRQIILSPAAAGPVEVSTLMDDNPKQEPEDDWGYSAVAFALDGSALYVFHGTIVYHLDLETLELREMYRECRSVDGVEYGYDGRLHLDRDGSLLVFGSEFTRMSPLDLLVKSRVKHRRIRSLGPGPGGRLLYTSREDKHVSVKMLAGMTASDADLHKARLKLSGAFVGAFLVACQRRPIRIVGVTLRSIAAIAIASARHDIEATNALVRAYRFTG